MSDGQQQYPRADYATRFQPGNRHGAHARPPEAVKLAQRLRKATDDGEEVLQMVLGIARGTARTGPKSPKTGKQTGKPWSEASRRWALELLMDRLWGKAKQSIELSGGEGAPRLNRAALSDEEAATYQRLLHKMRAPIEMAPIEAQALPAGAPADAAGVVDAHPASGSDKAG